MRVYKIFKYLLLLIPFGWCNFALADIFNSQSYETLAPIPGYIPNTIETNSLTVYLNGMFKLGVAVATGLAVVMIVIGGIQYMSTDAIGGKEEGKEKITGALWGLMIALCAYLLLNTINPALLNTSLNVDPATADVKDVRSRIDNLNLPRIPPQPDLSGYAGPNGFMGSALSQGPGFSDPSLYTSFNGSDISYFYQDGNGDMVFYYQDGSFVIQEWNADGTAPTGQGEYYNESGFRVINGREVFYTDYTPTNSQGISNPVYHFADGTYFVEYVDNNQNPIGGGELWNASGYRIIGGRAVDYQYYDNNGRLVIQYTSGPPDIADAATQQLIANNPFITVGNQASGPLAQRILQAGLDAANPRSSCYYSSGHNLGCAETVSVILGRVLVGDPNAPSSQSTYDLDRQIAGRPDLFALMPTNNPREAMPGDIVIYPSIGVCGQGGVCGHAMICSTVENGQCSLFIGNSSARETTVNGPQDLSYFTDKGLTAHIYRPRGG